MTDFSAPSTFYDDTSYQDTPITIFNPYRFVMSTFFMHTNSDE